MSLIFIYLYNYISKIVEDDNECFNNVANVGIVKYLL